MMVVVAKQTLVKKTAPKGIGPKFLRQMVQWGILVLLPFAWVMAAHMKAGG
jgi:hypothetical protein